MIQQLVKYFSLQKGITNLVMPTYFISSKEVSIILGIKCCYKCVEPKRHIGCHSTCEDYIKEKAEYEIKKQKQEKPFSYHLNSNGTMYSGKNPNRKHH